MVTCKLYVLSKENNSTKQPITTTVAEELSGNFVDDTTILSPRIKIAYPMTGSVFTKPITFNYCYISDFNRYYFITNWTFSGGFWIMDLDIDVLGTYKSTILATSQYVLRSASSRNTSVPDGIYPMLAQSSVSGRSLPRVFQNTLASGIYVVGIINSSADDAVGAVTYYKFTSSQFGAFKAVFLSDNWVGTLGITEITQNLVETYFNPFQYIASCRWFPVSSSAIAGTAVSSIPIGFWTITANATRISHAGMSTLQTTSIEILNHPQASTYGYYLNSNPYTQIMLDYPPFGNIPIDPSQFLTLNYLGISVNLDIISGIGILELTIQDATRANKGKIMTKSAMVGVEIQLAQVTTDYLGATATAIEGIGSVISGAIKGSMAGGVIGAGVGAIASGVGAVSDFAKSVMPQMLTSGANGCATAYEYLPSLTVITHNVASRDNAHFGSPLCASVTLSTLSGFTICQNAEVEINATTIEKNRIEQFLNGGFFIE